MPYLKLTTNTPLNNLEKPELLKQLSQLIAAETGKPENYVLIELNENSHMLFAGTSNPLAYLECKSINRCISFVTTVKQVVLHTTYQADGKSF